MQGVIFSLFADMVVEKFGMGFWNGVIVEAGLPSGGAYTVGRVYDDAEMHRLVGVLCARTGLTLPEALSTFGEYIFPHLIKSLPGDHPAQLSFSGLMSQVGTTIHREINRINPDASPPQLRYETLSEGKARLIYQSRRGLCAVCEGMIRSAGRHFQLSLEIRHLQCQLEGAESCILEIEGVGP